MAGVVINGQLDVRWPSLLDQRSGKLQGSAVVPYNDVAQALELPMSRRAIGLVIYVANAANPDVIDWYQFQGGKEDEHLQRIIVGTQLSGTIEAPGGTIVLPAGKLYREILLTGSGRVTIGLTENGNELMDDVDITPVDDEAYTGYINRKSATSKTLFVQTENSISYEIYAI